MTCRTARPARIARHLTTAVAAALALAGAAQAKPIYAIDIQPGPNRLVSFDSTAPGTATVIGNLGVAGLMTGLDFDGAGQLFASQAAGSNFFYSVNAGTGAATLIGGSGLRGTDVIHDLAWDPRGRRMLGVAAGGTSGTALYQIDTATGAASLLMQFASLSSEFMVGLAADLDGSLFLHSLNGDRWHKVSADLGTVTALGALGVDTNFQQGGTLDWSGDRTLYHGLLTISTAPSQRRLYTVDTTTGAGTNLGLLGSNLFANRGIEVADLAIAPTAVPEPGSVALAAAALGLLGWQRRRRSA